MLDPPTWRSSPVPLLHNVSVSGAPFAVMEKMSRASIFLPQHLFNLGPSQRRNEDEMKMRLGKSFCLFAKDQMGKFEWT